MQKSKADSLPQNAPAGGGQDSSERDVSNSRKFRLRKKRMKNTLLNRFSNSHSVNPKSKIEYSKWVGLSIIAFVLVVVGPVASAQQPGKIFRIGFLDPSTASGMAVLVDAFRQELRKLGWIEGKNFTIEYRFAEQKPERLPELAAELVRLKVDLIVVGSTPASLAAKQATGAIPIVMASVPDPVAAGLVASLAQPG